MGIFFDSFRMWHWMIFLAVEYMKRRTKRKRGGSPWTYMNWPFQDNATYYPLNSYGGQIDRTLRIGGTRKRK